MGKIYIFHIYILGLGKQLCGTVLLEKEVPLFNEVYVCLEFQILISIISDNFCRVFKFLNYCCSGKKYATLNKLSLLSISFYSHNLYCLSLLAFSFKFQSLKLKIYLLRINLPSVISCAILWITRMF